MAKQDTLPAAETNGRNAVPPDVYARRLTMVQAGIQKFRDVMGIKDGGKLDSNLIPFLRLQCANKQDDPAAWDMAQLILDCESGAASPEKKFRKSLLGDDPNMIPILGVFGARGYIQGVANDVLEKLSGLLFYLEGGLTGTATDEEKWVEHPPAPWKSSGELPADKVARLLWEKDQEEAQKKANGKRMKYASLFVDAMMAHILSEEAIKKAPSWDVEALRPRVIQLAVHGAIEHLCVLYVNKHIPGSFQSVAKKKEEESEKRSEHQLKRRGKNPKDGKNSSKKPKSAAPEFHDSCYLAPPTPVDLDTVAEKRAHLLQEIMREHVSVLLDQRLRNTDGEMSNITEISLTEFRRFLKDLRDTVDRLAYDMIRAKKEAQRTYKDHHASVGATKKT